MRFTAVHTGSLQELSAKIRDQYKFRFEVTFIRLWAFLRRYRVFVDTSIWTCQKRMESNRERGAIRNETRNARRGRFDEIRSYNFTSYLRAMQKNIREINLWIRKINYRKNREQKGGVCAKKLCVYLERKQYVECGKNTSIWMNVIIKIWIFLFFCWNLINFFTSCFKTQHFSQL